MPEPFEKRQPRILILGVGAFAYSIARVLHEHGAWVATYLTRTYAHYAPSLAGPTFLAEVHPDPVTLAIEQNIDFMIPMSIDWCEAPWAQHLLDSKISILSPHGEAMKIERERDFGRELCERFGIAFPQSYVASNRLEAERILKKDPRPYVIKNPLCSPTSPVHTVICESVEDTESWLGNLDYAEGIFMQEYMGRKEIGHVAMVSGGEIYSLVTNQEYKHSFDGNMGIIAGAPLGGLVEKDPDDKYGIAKELLHPLLPWFQEVNFSGPIQVTAALHKGKWHVLEYNVRMGVTCTQMILRLLSDPVKALADTIRNQPLDVHFKPGITFGCSLTLAGYGYPYIEIAGPRLPVRVLEPFDCDVWWNEIDIDANKNYVMTGHRIADVVALGGTMDEVIAQAYRNIRRIRCVSSYFRTDIGESKWPPGEE